MKKKPSPEPGPTIAVVIWDDAMMSGHWQDGQAPDPTESLRIYTTGWLVYESKDRIIIVQSLGEGTHGNVIHIPRGMILSMQQIGMA